nr:putative ribonuclease H-like domain-containing protein [Tanacetum cinerariifolium]
MPTQKAPSSIQTSKCMKTLRTSVKTVEHPTQAENRRKDIPKSSLHRHSWNRKSCFVCKSVNHLIKDCDYYKKNMVQKPVWNHTMRLVPLNAARPVTTVVPQTNVKHQRPATHVVNKSHSPIRRPIIHIPPPKTNNFHQKVTTVKAKQVNAVQGAKGNWFCGMKGIKREFSVARTPQHNEVAERKNMILIEAARTMLADSLLPISF